MYSLVTGLYQYMTKKPSYKILIVGLDGSGKTSFLEQVKAIEGQKSMKLEKIPPTVGLNLAKIEKRRAEFTFWDVGGQMVLRKIWDKYFSECNGLIFMIDGSDADRLKEVKSTVNRLYNAEAPTDLVDLPVLFLLNKKDKAEFVGFERID